MKTNRLQSRSFQDADNNELGAAYEQFENKTMANSGS